jgi:hypothetical protein
MLEVFIKTTTKRYLTSEEPTRTVQISNEISGLAYLLKRLVQDNNRLEGYLEDWLTGTAGGGAGQVIGIRRAVISALSSSPGKELRSCIRNPF